MRMVTAGSAILLATLIGLASCAGSDNAAGSDDGAVNLFTSLAAPSTMPAVAEEPWAVRVVVVEIDTRIFARDAVAVGDSIVVRLFDDERVLAVVTALDNVAGHKNLRGRIIDPVAGGDLLLSVGRETAVGSVRIPGREHHYYLRHAPDIRSHVLIEVDPTREDVLPEAPPEEWPE